MITVFIPAFNEELNIKRIPSELLPFLKEEYEVLIVDDGSSDHTVSEVRKLQKKHKGIRLVKHKGNKGLGMAVRTGIQEAKGELFIPLDCDFTFHPKQIPRMLRFFREKNADCVIGSPFLRKKDRTEILSHRLWLSQGVNKVYQILLGKKITEISGIFRIYRTKDLKEMTIESRGYDINAEILFKLIQKKKRVYETYASLTKRKFGESKLNFWKEAKNHIKMLCKITAWKMKI